jgi:protein-tyrosine phosphatase
MPTQVLFVCLGNICRSPAAEAAFAHLATNAGAADEFKVDSAGTGAWHIGERADSRMRRAARQRGIAIESTARQVTLQDFEDFDVIVAMDSSNFKALTGMAPATHRAKVVLLRDFDPNARGEDVPDPYYGDDEGFDEVLDIVMAAGEGLLGALRKDRGI